jgi:hypothetical protein
MSFSYQYISFQFEKKGLYPVTIQEYDLIKADLNQFLGIFIEYFNKKVDKHSNAYRFNGKRYLIFIGSAIALYFLSSYLESIDYNSSGIEDNIAGFFYLVTIMLGLIIIFQPLIYALSAVRSASSATGYEVEAKLYYKFHHMKIKETKNYEEYLDVISKTPDKEYTNFTLKNIF